MTTLFKKIMLHPEFSQLDVIFEAEWETESPDDHFEFQEHRDFAYSGQDDANWFCAIVRVELRGTQLFGQCSLGCCSWSSFDEFMQDQYFFDMINEATQDLVGELNNTSDAINEFSVVYNKVS